MIETTRQPASLDMTFCIVAKTQMHSRLVQSIHHYRNFHRDLFPEYDEFKLDIQMDKSHIEHARSMIATSWFQRTKNDDDLMIFIDGDHNFAPSDIKRLVDNLKANPEAVVSVLVYPSKGGIPTTIPFDWEDLLRGRDKRVRYAGTGFMAIKRKALKELGKKPRYNTCYCSGMDLIPFFKSDTIPSSGEDEPPAIEELKLFGLPVDTRLWLGEDYYFCYQVRKVFGESAIVGDVSPTMQHEVYQNKTFYPKSEIEMLRDDPDIVYYCGNSRVLFDPTMRNLGGSEQAVVNLCREWTRLGKKVVVYGNVNAGTYDGVDYRRVETINTQRGWRTVILWRGFGMSDWYKFAKVERLFVDLHDNTDRSLFNPYLIARVTKFFFKSSWHRNMYPEVCDDKAIVLENGLRKMWVGETPDRIPHSFLYASSYTRGLVPLLGVWDRIKKRFPDATLTVCYGRDAGQPEGEILDKFIEKHPEVRDLGKITLEELDELRKKTAFHIYPCNNLDSETDCLTIRESFRMGCYPIVPYGGVFNERASFNYKTLKDLPDSPHMDLEPQSTAGCGSSLGRIGKNDLSWEETAERWLEVGNLCKIGFEKDWGGVKKKKKEGERLRPWCSHFF